MRRHLGLSLCAVYLFIFLVAPASAADPTRAEVEKMLQDEPLTVESWEQWQPRLKAWRENNKRFADPAYDAARKLMLEVDPHNQIVPANLKRDAVAWHMYSWALIRRFGDSKADVDLAGAEKALEESIRLDPTWGYNLRSQAYLKMISANHHQQPLDVAAVRALLQKAEQLTPGIRLDHAEGMIAVSEKRMLDAQRIFQKLADEDPEDIDAAKQLMQTLMGPETPAGQRVAKLRELSSRFPQDGMFAFFLGIAHVLNEDAVSAKRELARAKELGFDPAEHLTPDQLNAIDEAAQPNWVARIAYFMIGAGIFYPIVIALMAVVGFLLAGQTRGDKALQLLGIDPHEAIQSGRAPRTRRESLLAWLYAFSLFVGLILFYIAVPIAIATVLLITAGLLLLIFSLGRIPIKLVLLVVVIGLGMVWALLKSLFSSASAGNFGLPATRERCPQLFDLLHEVASKVETDAVDEVYIAPGAAIGVHQTGRGPFGIFGVKNRVLTLGMSTLNSLTIGELKAILAHEYAHFSHQDTFYSRFIYQVQMSIENALNGMGAAGGWVTYVNPVYWFFYLYYKAYTLLAAGYSRSREFLADRMAGALYGRDVFESALRKVSTEGQLFETTMYSSIDSLLTKNESFRNMYEAFRSYRDEQLDHGEREELYKKMLQEEKSIFASHPTFSERIEALANVPTARQTEDGSALLLFADAPQWEEELTTYLTTFLQYMRTAQVAEG